VQLLREIRDALVTGGAFPARPPKPPRGN